MKNFPKGKIIFLTDLNESKVRPDDEIWAEDLRSHGFLVEGHPWETFDSFESTDAVIFRSTWNYYKKYSEFNQFLERLERVGVMAFNSPQMVRKNIDKQYLKSLESFGVKIIPTQWFTNSDLENLSPSYSFHKARTSQAHTQETLIVKPTISAGSFSTFRISLADSADIKFAIRKVLENASCAMVQPYLTEIENDGEWSLIFARSKLIHALRKFPKIGDFRVQAEHGGNAVLMDPPPHILAVSEKCLEWVKESSGEHPLYARVDGVETLANGFLVMEIELTEPSLFFTLSPKSVREFSAVLLKSI